MRVRKVKYKNLTLIDTALERLTFTRKFEAVFFTALCVIICCLPLIFSNNAHLINSEPVYFTAIGVSMTLFTYRIISAGGDLSDSRIRLKYSHQDNIYLIGKIIKEHERDRYLSLARDTLTAMNNAKKNFLFFIVPSMFFVPIGIATFNIDKVSVNEDLRPIWVLPQCWYEADHQFFVLLSLHLLIALCCFVIFISMRAIIIHALYCFELSKFEFIGVPSIEIDYFLGLFNLSLFACAAWSIGVMIVWALFNFEVTPMSLVFAGAATAFSIFSFIMPIVSIRKVIVKSRRSVIDNLEAEIINHEGNAESSDYFMKVVFVESQKSVGKLDRYISFLLSILLGAYMPMILKYYNLIF